MGSLQKKNSRLLILFLAMAVLLPVLAALQYYWLGQVSEGASERLQSSLRSSANSFRHDFNRELIRAYLNFHLEPEGPSEDVQSFNVARLERWNQTSAYPQLISGVFVVERDAAKMPHLLRVDLQTRRLEPVEWSGEYANWRERFMPSTGEDPSRQTFLESFAEDIPALIIPLGGTTPEQPSHNSSITPGFTIVRLNLNYIQGELIPALAQLHFNDRSSDYDVAVTSINDPSRVIYSSRSPVPDLKTADVSTQIFGLEADELEDLLRSETRTQSPLEQAGSGPRPSRLVKLRLLKRATLNSATTSSELDGRWLLSIKHKSGSLAAAVTSARRRNLAISFGILLLLGAGILMTAISTRRAERLAQQQINFVAGVTHELRTPLAVICSAGENLAHGIVDTPQKAAQYGEVIHGEGRRLTEMVERVLEFAGAQSGKQRYDFRPLAVAAFIDDAVDSSRAQILAKDFEVETSVPSDLPPVMGDRAALRRALQNLINNAIKYDGQNRWLRVSAQRDGTDAVQVMVEDRSMGIDPSDLPHIFEPFYRGREAVAAQIEGSGVGLSIVKQIVEAHGGKIDVKSRPGSGSTFTLYLPAAPEPDQRDEEGR